jgi:hypothetical protein
MTCDNVLQLPPEEGKPVRKPGRQPQRTAGVWRLGDGSYQVRCKVEGCVWRVPVPDEDTAFAMVDRAIHELVLHPELVKST